MSTAETTKKKAIERVTKKLKAEQEIAVDTLRVTSDLQSQKDERVKR
jgi:hypothetical protein